MKELTNLFDIELNTINTFDFIIGFIITLILSLIIKYSYNKHSLSVSNKSLTSSLFPFFSIAIFVIVVTIKSSLVLSLGLVGALSIIRFRTAVKEPEQLIYSRLADFFTALSSFSPFPLKCHQDAPIYCNLIYSKIM